MPQYSFNINDDLDKEFRDMVFKTKGMKRGVLLSALVEALELWVSAGEIKSGKKLQ